MGRKVLITTPTFAKYSKEPLKLLQQFGLETVFAEQPIKSDEQLLPYLNDTVAIITGLEPITSKVILAAKELKVIAKHGIGVDNIDLNAAKEGGVMVVNAPGTNGDAVADLVFGHALALARDIPKADFAVRSGKWPRVIGKSVWGRTMGIIGFGAIGKGVALRAQGFNMEVLAYDICFDEEFAKAHCVKQASIEEILQNADFITLHLPLTQETQDLFSYEKFALMKKTAYLINTSRGGVVDESALIDALTKGTIAGAALDVFSNEPPTNKLLLDCPNIILSPHMGGYTDQALNNTSLYAAQRVLEVLRGENPKSRII